MKPASSHKTRFPAISGGAFFVCALMAATTSATETVTFSTTAAGKKQNMRWGYDVSQSSFSVAANGIVGLGGPQNVDWVRLGSAYADPGLLNWDPVTRVGELSQSKKDRLDFEFDVGNEAGLKPYTITRGESTGRWFWATGSHWDGVNVDRYAGAIMAEAQYFWDRYGIVCQGVGLRNEADFWVSYSSQPQPTNSQFGQIAAIVKAHPLFAKAEIFGPSTLSPSVSAYNSIAGPVTMAETHKLGGSTSELKSLMQTAHNNGDGFVNTEVHGVAEMLLQGNYNGDGGNFWDHADFSRGTLALSQRGGWQTGYAENLGNETAGAVYRSPEGDLRAFVGGMERTGARTDYRFVSTDRDVYFDGFGPIREYMMAAYKEKYGYVVNIDYGGDAIGLGTGFEGNRWKLVNRQTGQVLSVVGGSTGNGADINVAADTGGEHQKWDLVRSQRGAWGLSNANSGLALTPVDGSSSSGARIEQWNTVSSGYKYWRFSSTGDGYFYLQNYDNINYLTAGASFCVQSSFTGSPLQQWRFVSADPTPTGTLAASYQFEGNASDSAGSNHATTVGSPTYVSGQSGQALNFDGTDDYATLPSGVSNSVDVTISSWVYWNGGSAFQRIFDFGNDTNSYMYLTPSSGEGLMRFAITTGGGSGEQVLITDSLPTNQWVHLALTLRGNLGVLYLNGKPKVAGRIFVDTSNFNPTLNYIGKSQYAGDPLFSGRIDDFRVFNYALNQAQVRALVPTPAAGFYAWTGGSSSEWSTGTTASPKNWNVSSTGTSTDYTNGNSVVFDDSATGYSVDIPSNVTPTTTTFSNSTTYTLGGAAGISGTGGLVKSGAGILNLNNANTHIGATAITGGTVNLNGSLSGTTITISDAAFNQSGSGVISGNSSLTSFGATSLAGNNTLGTVRSAGASSIQLTGGATTASGQVSIGDIGGGPAVLSVSAGTLNANKGSAPSLLVGGASGAVGIMNVSGGTVTTASEVWVAGASGANGTLNISGGILNVPSWLAVGRSSGDTGTLNMSGGTLNVTGHTLTLASFSGTVGEMNLSGGTVNLASDFFVGEGGTGTLNISGNATLNANGPNGVRVGVNAGSTGIVNLNSGATLLTNAPFTKGNGTAVFGFDGGTLRAAASGSPFFQGFSQVLIRAGGARIDTAGFDVTITNPLARELVSGNGADLTKMNAGTLTLAGSTSLLRLLDVDTGSTSANDGILRAAHPQALSSPALIRIRNSVAGYSSLELDGAQGSILTSAAISLNGRNNSVPAIRNVGGNNTLAGTITAQTGGTDYRIESNAGLLDLSGSVALTSAATGSRTFTLQGSGEGIVSGVIANGSASPLNLVKSGTGTWTLSGSNTSTGSTTVSSGTLSVTGSLAAGNTVTVANGAILTGTGTIAGPVSFAGGSRLRWGLVESNPVAGGLSAGAVAVGSGAAINLVFNAAGSTVDFSSSFWAANHSWPVLTCSSMSGTFALGSISQDGFGNSIAPYGTFYLQQTATGVTLFYASLNSAPPLPPTGGSANGFPDQVTLGWDESFGASSYNVLRSISTGGPYELIASGLLDRTYTDWAVTNGSTYYYVIVAVNQNGQSNPTAEMIGKPHLPTTINKLDNAINLDQATSWSNDMLPTSGDTARWAGLAGANSVNIGSGAEWNGIQVAATGGAVGIGGANTLMLGRGGVDMSAATQNLTITSNLTLGAGSQVWNVASGRTLALATGTFTRSSGTTLNIQGSGTASSSMAGLANDGSSGGGLIRWATVGSGTGTRFAALSNGTIGSYTGGTSAANFGWTSSNPNTINYDVAGVTSAIGVSRAANTVRYTGAAGNQGYGSSNTNLFPVNALINAGTGTLTVSQAAGLSGVVASTGGGELVFNAANAGITISAPIYNSGASTTGATTNVTNGATASTVVITGTNAVTLSGSNSFTGGTILNSGTLLVGNNAALGTGSITLNGGTLSGTGGFEPTLANAIIANGAASINSPSGSSLRLNGPITGSGALAVSALFNGNQLVLAGNNSEYRGTITVTGVNTRLVAGQAGSSSASWVVNGVLQLNATSASNTYDLGALSGSGNINSSATNGTTTQQVLRVGGRNADTTFSGTIQNNSANNSATGNGPGTNNVLALTKIGKGTLTLSGTNSYTGPTTVSGGTLMVNGTLSGSSAVLIGNGATLSGTGTSSGAVTIAGGGTLTPGSAGSGGTFQASGGLTLNHGSLLNIGLSATGTSGRVAVTGSLVTGGTTTVNITALNGFGAGTYPLITSAAAVNAANFQLGTTPAGYGYMLSAASGTLSLTVVAPAATPTGLTATGGSSEIILNWTASSGATSYNIKRSTTPESGYQTVASGVTATTYTNSGLASETTYYYVVTAVNLAGESEPSTEASATTLSPPTPGEAWRQQNFGANWDNDEVAGDAADPDKDGISNLLERAFGGDPNIADPSILPRIDPDAPLLSIIYRKARLAEDLVYEVQESTDLSPTEWSMATGDETPISDNGTVETLRFTAPVSSASKKFLRVRVTSQE